MKAQLVLDVLTSFAIYIAFVAAIAFAAVALYSHNASYFQAVSNSLASSGAQINSSMMSGQTFGVWIG